MRESPGWRAGRPLCLLCPRESPLSPPKPEAPRTAAKSPRRLHTVPWAPVTRQKEKDPTLLRHQCLRGLEVRRCAPILGDPGAAPHSHVPARARAEASAGSLDLCTCIPRLEAPDQRPQAGLSRGNGQRTPGHAG